MVAQWFHIYTNLHGCSVISHTHTNLHGCTVISHIHTKVHGCSVISHTHIKVHGCSVISHTHQGSWLHSDFTHPYQGSWLLCHFTHSYQGSWLHCHFTHSSRVMVAQWFHTSIPRFVVALSFLTLIPTFMVALSFHTLILIVISLSHMNITATPGRHCRHQYLLQRLLRATGGDWHTGKLSIAYDNFGFSLKQWLRWWRLKEVCLDRLNPAVHTSDLQGGTVAATLPGTSCHRSSDGWLV